MNNTTYNEVMDFVKDKSEYSNIAPDKIAANSDAIMRKVSVAGEFVKLLGNIKNMFHMVKAYCKKQYTKIPKKTLVSVCFALAYVASPVDAIPDNTPVVGYVDDIAVVERVLKSANKDIEDFVEWESQQSSAA